MPLDDASADIELAQDAAARAASERAERLNGLGHRLIAKARENANARSIVEQRWLEDVRQYNGVYDAETEGRLKAAEKSRVFLGLTRSKTNIAESRIADMLFPTDDKNYEVGPTPVPDLQNDPQGGASDVMGRPIVDGASGEQMSRGKVAEQIMAKARERAKRMEAEIDDQLNEASYPSKAREAIHQAAVMGTGVIKGPIVVGRTRKAWTTLPDGSWGMKTAHDKRPSVEWVDVWNFFPDMTALRQQDLEFVFERRFVTKKQLLEYRDNPYYIAESIQSAAEMEARSTHVAANHLYEIRQIHGTSALVEDNRYEIWAYHGPIKASDLKDCGCDPGVDENEDVYGCVEICGGLVIKAYINPLNSDDLPFSMFVFERDETCIFGFGVPYLLRDPQRVANGAWRMLLENMGLSFAPQIFVNRKYLYPADGDWRLRGGKVWYTDEDQAANINNLFGQFKIDPLQVELTALLKDAMQLMDETTNLPLIAQGQQTPLTKTAQGMAMLMNAANTVLRRSVKEWDDGVTRPMLTRFYDWNMQYNRKQDIKGDYEVDARGASVLLAKEIQAQNLMVLGAQFAASPAFGPMMKPLQLLRKIVQAHHLSADELVLSDAEWQQAQQSQAEAASQGQGADPRIAAEQMRHEGRMKEAEFERETKLIISGAQREIEVLQLAQQYRLSLEQLQARLAEVQMKGEIDMAKQTQETRVKQAFGSGL